MTALQRRSSARQHKRRMALALVLALGLLAAVAAHVEGLVADATMSGNWGAGASGTASCVTDASGTCTVTSALVQKRHGTISFAVTGISHASLTYDAAANHEPEGDSDGTTISVNKP